MAHTIHMSTNAASTETPAPTEWVWFTTAKSGRKMAFRFDRRQHRGFRVPTDKAEMMVATETWENVGHHPFKPCPSGCTFHVERVA